MLLISPLEIKKWTYICIWTNEISDTMWSLIGLGLWLWCLTPLSILFRGIVAVNCIGVGDRNTRRKPPTRVTNNLIQNTAVIPDIMFNILILDTNRQHSTWLYSKRNGCIFAIVLFPQNSIIPTALRMEFNLHTSTATLELAVYIQIFSTSPYSGFSTIKLKMFKESPHPIFQKYLYLIIHQYISTK